MTHWYCKWNWIVVWAILLALTIIGAWSILSGSMEAWADCRYFRECVEWHDRF